MSQPLSTCSTTDACLADRYGRKVDYLRLALTSRCNLRCVYCMREEHAEVVSPKNELSVQEVRRLLKVLAGMGVEKVRFTGGEPLLREDIVELVRLAKSTEGIRKVAITTNGLLLDRYADDLLEAGLDALNFSLDTMDSQRYAEITRRNLFTRVERNLMRILDHPQLEVKVNVLLMRGINTDEISRFVELTRERALTVRFMELMPFDDHQIWRTGRFLGADKMLELLKQHYPAIESVRGTATEYFSFTLPGYRGAVAMIPAFTRNFCSACTRLRVTSSGMAMSCLYAREGTDLRPALTAPDDGTALRELLCRCVREKPRDGREAGSGSPRTSMSEIGG